MDLVTGEQKASIDSLINSHLQQSSLRFADTSPSLRAWGRVCVSDLALLLGPLQDPLLDGALADEAVDGHLLGLTQPVSSVHGLLVHCGVPVAVVEDDLEQKGDFQPSQTSPVDALPALDSAAHRVGGRQVDTEPSGPGAEQKDEDVRPGEERWRMHKRDHLQQNSEIHPSSAVTLRYP